MLSTNFVTHLAVFSFEIDSFCKLQMIKLKLSDRPIGILCLISLAHWATRLLWSKFTCPRQLDLDFFLPWMKVIQYNFGGIYVALIKLNNSWKFIKYHTSYLLAIRETTFPESSSSFPATAPTSLHIVLKL